MDELTEYERARAANIAANQSLLAQIGIKDVQEEISASVPTPNLKKEKLVQPRKRKAEVAPDNTPRRQSMRLRSSGLAVPANETSAQRRRREAEEAKLQKEAEEESERLAAEERLAKMPRHQDLEFEVLAEDFEEEETKSWNVFQSTLVKKKYKQQPGSWTPESSDEKKVAQEKDELVAELKKLTLASRAKVCKERIYSAAYHPITTKDVIFFGDKAGTIGIWDARATPDDHEDDADEKVSAQDGQYWSLQPHWPRGSKSSISSIRINPRDAHSIFTSSYDGTVRTTDFVSGISKELAYTEDYLPSTVDLVPNGYELWMSDSGGGIQHLDTRERSRSRRWQLTEKEKIGCVSVNPIAPHLLLTASNNRTMRMWDARYLKKVESTTEKSEDGDDTSPESTWDEIQEYLGTRDGPKCLWGEWRHRQSVSSAFWDISGRRIVSTSYDDTLRVWDIRPSALKRDGPLKSFRPTTEIKHNCQTGRWVTILRARWSENPNVYPHFTIGNMTQSLDVVGYNGEVLAKLSNREKVSAVQAVTASHPSIVARASRNGIYRMMSTPSVYSRSDVAGSVHAPGYGHTPYGHQDMNQLNWFIDDAFPPCDFRLPSFQAELDLLFNSQATITSRTTSDPSHILCHSEVSFSSSLCQSWPEEPFPGQYLMPEMESTQPMEQGASGSTIGAARSCSPASESSFLSDAGSFSSELSFVGQTLTTSGPGSASPSIAGPSQVVERQQQQPMPTLAVPSSAGPIRRGRGRPRKDAPPVHQPPPLCTYVDPLTGTPCNKLLNRHHDLPRHLFKHAQEEAALVNSGRLLRELATLLPDDWKEKDELKLPCRFCSQVFSRADAVKRHEKNEHKHRPRKTR
ncbi:unnamed protein product [Rhizoctonia solani]|uniref:DNA damage-binding protein CMR1 n=1 Tax=Rhizoctonia solani TaxID=456999 RepID=A0A8H3AJ09_9AGAM|nr:unnamed protein product [Rhizoctonia solani]